ncbi:LOW QUALITY PROTEIN: hypothetical protein RJ639_012408 [Escallonia herrerae]|uniref:ASCH domain-containing protein n=1 Tax=Escallonia herrerae TaxID=1293975 RepID=A0AA88VQ86_9ASTE|nr:LOW QUALITY PROTEIN: hypothetical protein RJ639_012408 [Escallonia herrerae]
MSTPDCIPSEVLSFSGDQSVGMDEQQPSSPRVATVQLEDCIEELLKFTLTSAIDGTLGVDIGLSKHYRSNLLKEDPDSPCPDTSGIKSIFTAFNHRRFFGNGRFLEDFKEEYYKWDDFIWLDSWCGGGLDLLPTGGCLTGTGPPKLAFAGYIKGAMTKIKIYGRKVDRIICSCLLDAVLSEGVPPYPLYKRLAASLCQCISSRAFCRTHNMMAFIDEDKSWKQKEDEWSKSILQHGSELLNVRDFELHVQEPFFTQLKDGQKTIEGRCALGDYTRTGSRSLILLNKCLVLQVLLFYAVEVTSFISSCETLRCPWYATFHEMLEAESLVNVLPGVGTIEEGMQVYRKFYSEDKEQSNGVLAVCVTNHTSQLYNSLAAILLVRILALGFGYESVQRLLGFVHTVGTVLEVLPPPRSTLLSSSLLPHNFNIKGSALTDGARALAKHVNRSSGRYWGTFCGSDSDKNNLAMDAISNLLAHSCWLNMHIVSPHGVVFEIRVSDGYGARWSEDGTKFIGFLEPYTADGHLKGWKH